VKDGFFITFEGIEGAGKSTQVRLLADALGIQGRKVLETREPGGTELGEELRRLVKHYHGPDAICAETELLMMCASRAQLVRQVIRPFMIAGGIVICDRFADSSTVYQGYARGLDLDAIQTLHRLTVGDSWPDLTIVLDLETEAGLARAEKRGAAQRPDRFEAETAAFHQRVRDGFLKLAAAEPGRFRVVPAALPPAAIHKRVLELVLHALG